ncbi:helix-turn-helix domain-containing protein [Kibdelosporangium lantanae]|uniref:Helix-turn-helix domain-containing protein n=1 Tax=Kibdelosporangium lantanae TaxID=1497396 RepID=A0ABW3M6E5_9PSEU
MANTPLQLPVNGKRLREYRERAGLTQRDLAFLCGLTRYQITRRETGKAKPEHAALAPLVRGLNKALQQTGGSKHAIHMDDLLEYPADART